MQPQQTTAETRGGAAETRGGAAETWGGVAETATATVFFAGRFAAKLKKPFDFSYVDFSTRLARRRACEREVRLNRRLAPDVYLGVADLVDPAGRVIDHLVLMRRMPAARRLAAMVRTEPRSQLERRWLPAVARLLADFHTRAPISTDPRSPGSHAAVVRLWESGIRELAAVDNGVVPDSARRSIATLGAAYLAGRAPLFRERLRQCYVRDGHGDLLADDIFMLDDGPRVLDCLEFDERLRICDVWMDVAFLAMDLERLGFPDLADAFLDRYGDYSGTSAPPSLRHFFIAYRALGRAKVAAIRVGQGDAAAAAEAQQLARMCVEHLRRATVTVTLVGGLPGSGKTTLATAISTTIDASYLSSDVVRRELYPDPAGRYDEAATRRTYAEMLQRAEVALERGESVVLDATWREASLRAAAREVADRTSAVLTELQCVVEDSVAERRLANRRDDVSEADIDVFLAMRHAFAPWPQARRVDTGCASHALVFGLGAVTRNVRRLESAASGPKPLGTGPQPSRRSDVMAGAGGAR